MSYESDRTTILGDSSASVSSTQEKIMSPGSNVMENESSRQLSLMPPRETNNQSQSQFQAVQSQGFSQSPGFLGESFSQSATKPTKLPDSTLKFLQKKVASTKRKLGDVHNYSARASSCSSSSSSAAGSSQSSLGASKDQRVKAALGKLPVICTQALSLHHLSSADLKALYRFKHSPKTGLNMSKMDLLLAVYEKIQAGAYEEDIGLLRQEIQSQSSLVTISAPPSPLN